MAEASISIDQEHFSCSICLYLLKEPVTTPCGHSFCMVCINGFWDEEDQKKVYSCPQCREAFAPRPVLRKSNVLTEIIDILQKTEQQTSFAQSLKIISHEAQDVECDSCIGVKEKAVKSCLTCLASYCDTHVQAHHESPAFKKHMLITALSNLQEKTCAQHCKLLEVFCRTDQRVICYQCSMDKHKDHDTVPVQDEWMEKKKYFGDLQQKHQNRLESREKTLLELKDVIEAYKRSAQEAVEDSDKVFAELLLSIEKRRSEVTELIRAQEKAELAQTAEVIKQLEQEIADLKRRQAGLEKLSQTTGYVHFLQRFQFLSPELETADTFKVDFNRQWSFENFKKSIIQLKEEIEDFCKEKVEKVSENAVTFDQIIIMPEPETREEFLKYSCELSLDPNTANYNLELSNDDTHVTCDNKPHKYPDHPERFTFWQQVLSKQSVSPRSYWEAELAEKYGDVFSLRWGSEKTVFISGHKMVKEALVTQLDSFADRPVVPLFHKIFKGLGVALSNGYLWKNQRKFIVTHLRHFGEGRKALELSIQQESIFLCEAFKAEKGPFDPQFFLNNAVSNIISALVFGHRFEYHDENFLNILRLDAEAVFLAGSTQAQLYNAFPRLFDYLPGPHRKIFANYAKNISVLRRRNKKTQGELGSLKSSGLHRQFPSRNGEEKVQAEIDKVIGQSRQASMADKPNMPYTEAVIHEIQRVGNIVPLGFPKMACKDTVLGGFFIPKGTAVTTNLSSVLNDKNEWETPDTFNPGHFLDDQGQFLKKDAFLPFSAGRRVCLGEQLARMELFLFFTSLFQCFTFSPCPGEELSLEGQMGFTYSPRPYRMCVTPR
ncbi:hypothetical protein PHYPO_G00092210 [Pangasianodon hypophthalmus]|uniref:RING-type domain-containing protein n=1 Tax=Pangasianodon hypophthalmus TaxID=310915 RepID=A0A5N5LC50_PANHP|nr:hypothetical protein PHYPO_G00092210 [Pangasianodon hypophthalmus]